MPMVPLLHYFPELAVEEMRTATVQDWEGLPDGQYGFLELYCNEAGCDCRRVLINVVTPDTGAKIWATINYGWESERFYRRWTRDSEMASWSTGARLDPLGEQTRYAEALLELFRLVIQDPAYVERLKRHYRLFKGRAPGGGPGKSGRRRSPVEQAAVGMRRWVREARF
jgi:hypothetical protein